MAYNLIIAALSIIASASPGMATQTGPAGPGAPPAGPNARYCLRVDPVTGSRMETIRCETREVWAQLEVDVDKEWPTEGVRVVNG